MTQETPRRADRDSARVLVLSMSLAPCHEVGGKRFSFLSRYLSQNCAEYHILARREKSRVVDATAFTGNVHRVPMFPYFSTGRKRGLSRVLTPLWKRWLCLVDPYIGWVIPATIEGLRLNRKHRFNVVIVTIPSFSAVISAICISNLIRSRLIIDYRDPWTNHRKDFPKFFGRRLCTAIERSAIRRAHTIVFCSEIMRKQFVSAFRDIAPANLEVIYNGFDEHESGARRDKGEESVTKMLYAGRFYGTRRLSVIASVLAQMAQSGEISPETFQFHLYAPLDREDGSLIESLKIGNLIHVHKPVPYKKIRQIMARSDILFLPSGNDAAYAVPFKFFDYLSAKRPIFAIAPKESSVAGLMQSVDCGEFAEFGNTSDIERALKCLLRKEKSYTFNGSERFRWNSIAKRYQRVIDSALITESAPASVA